MKVRYSVALLLCLAAACHRTRTFYANTENGAYDPGAPPLIRPARTLDALLRDRRVGGLVVNVEDLIESRSGSFELELRRDHERGTRVRVDTIATVAGRDLGELPSGTYWGRVRRVGFNQRTFLVRITPGYVDTLDVHLGWSR